MPADTSLPDSPRYLTTKEVADLLRVRERKVYDLAGADEIPHRRITGKLLFPRDEIMAWIEGSGMPGAAQHVPAVLSGSHDPLLAWAVGASDCGLAVLQNGSTEGLTTFARGEAALAGLHLPEGADWNVATVSAQGVQNSVLITWAVRQRGLIVDPALADEIQGVADLRGRRMVLRQAGAGAAALLDQMLEAEGMAQGDLAPVAEVARTEHDAAAAVASGTAEAALGIAAMARQFKLGFVPILEERFDLLIDRWAYFTPPVQALLQFSREPEFAAKADSLGGYDLSTMGTVRWNAA